MQINLLEFLKPIREVAEKAWNDIQTSLKTPDAQGNTPIDRILQSIQNKVEIGCEVLSPEAIKIALGYHEISRESLSFSDLVSIVKQNYSLTPGIKVCVLKSINNDITNLDIVACSTDNHVMFDATHPWCHVIICAPAADLLKMFENKSMLVLQ